MSKARITGASSGRFTNGGGSSRLFTTEAINLDHALSIIATGAYRKHRRIKSRPVKMPTFSWDSQP